MSPQSTHATRLSAESIADRLAAIVGPQHVITAEADLQPYVTEWRGYYRGRTPAVVRPASTAEVAAIVAFANGNGIPVVPQSGNTGLVGGQVPDESGREIVVSLQRMDRIRGPQLEDNRFKPDIDALQREIFESWRRLRTAPS